MGRIDMSRIGHLTRKSVGSVARQELSQNDTRNITMMPTAGAIYGNGPHRETIHVGHHQPDDHHRQRVLRDSDDA